MRKRNYNISEQILNGANIEIKGRKGAGKTSIIDAIRFALTHSSERDWVIKNGADEGEIIIETDSGLTIDRKARKGKVDAISVKENLTTVNKPETFLKSIITPLQLNPVEFTQMSKADQNRAILDLIEFDWNMDWIREKFGEIPQGVDYSQNILQILNDIQSDNGEYKEDGIDNLIPIPYGVKLEPMSNTKLADSQFLELKQYSAIQIASAFGIKPVQIGDLTKASYASAEAQQLSFLIDTLLYIIKQYEEEINYKVLNGTNCYAKFNVDVILRADFRNKVETLATAVNSFMMTPDEARRKLDLGNKPGGDQLVGNGSTIPLAQVGAQYNQNAGGGEKE
ncbi:MAG: phage portal protein [Ruminococcus sp.]|nr:phage portal protein [Ruminococcus sp.]